MTKRKPISAAKTLATGRKSRAKNPSAPAARPSSRLRTDLPRPVHTDEPYSDEESEYLRAVGTWQKRTEIRFPTACDYRQILISLGYHQ